MEAEAEAMKTHSMHIRSMPCSKRHPDQMPPVAWHQEGQCSSCSSRLASLGSPPTHHTACQSTDTQWT